MTSQAIAKQATPKPTAPAAPHGDGPPLVEAAKLSKRFGALKALEDVSITIRPGSFRALLGENGAGKSTLVKCIMGTYQAETGTVRVGTSGVEITTPRQAHALGLGMVYQHFTLVENMTVVENLVLARQKVPAFIRWKDEVAALHAFMERMPFRIDPTARVRNLAAGEKQKVELLKQLYLERKVLILDEPTSVLTPDEADEVLGMVAGMCRRGDISALIITHKFREVQAFCDEVTVLRHGRLTGEGRVCDLTPAAMGEMMMGTAVVPPPAAREPAPPGTPRALLAIDGLTAENEVGVPMLRGLSLQVKPHEIVGIVGVSGNGQRELVQVLAGQRQASAGTVSVHGAVYGGSRKEMARHHFHVLPEMPLQNACVPTMTTAENLAFRRFDGPAMTLGRYFVNLRAVSRRACDLIERFRVRPASPTARIGNLSGGNVQRAVLARELGEDVEVLVVANPCFGLDFKAVSEIRSRIMQARNRGAAVLLVSEDLDEILELADRVLVISAGKIVHEESVAGAERHVIGRHMAGH